MKSVFKLLILALGIISCLSCSSQKDKKGLCSNNEPISMLQELSISLKNKKTISKDEFTLMVKSYKELEDTLAVLFVRDSMMSDIHKFTLISITQSQVVNRLCELADSCEWSFNDIPEFQQKIYSYSNLNKSNRNYIQAVEFYKRIKPGNYLFKNWDILINDYNNFLSYWSRAKINSIDDFYHFLHEENDLFTALISNCIYTNKKDLSPIVNKTNEVCQHIMKNLTDTGVSSIKIMAYMYARTNHRLIQNAVSSLEILSQEDKLSSENIEMCVSLLLSPFVCISRQLVGYRTEEQILEIKQIGKTIQEVLEKNCSQYGLEVIYLKDMPLSIIKEIITNDID